MVKACFEDALLGSLFLNYKNEVPFYHLVIPGIVTSKKF